MFIVGICILIVLTIASYTIEKSLITIEGQNERIVELLEEIKEQK